MGGIRCGHCGKFCKYFDSYAPFGGWASYEPPDEVYLCEKCAKEMYDYYKKVGRPPNHWMKSSLEINLAEELGLVYDEKNYRWRNK